MLNRIIGVLVFGFSILFAWGWMQYDHFSHTALKLPPEGMIYHLQSGSSVNSLATDLAAEGIIEQPLMLRLLARLTKQAGGLKAGEYRIPAPVLWDDPGRPACSHRA